VRAAWLLALAFVVGSGFFTSGATSQEACPWRWQAKPENRPGEGPPPRAIGDSVMVWSVEPLARHGFRSDARMCREWPEGRGMIKRLRRKGKLPRRIVMALGSNGTLPMWRIERILPLLEGGHVLAIVTPRDVGGTGGQDAKNVRRAASKHPAKIEALDWVRYSRGKDHWFGGDGVHVKERYTNRYVSCIKQALPRYRRPSHPCSPN